MEGGRFQHGALDLETIETRPVTLADQVVDIARLEKNRATSLIEEFMVAANGVIARTFEDAGVASIRRIVRTPKRWDRIVELAKERKGVILPAEPDSKALNDFLLEQKQKDPDHFPDLSLIVVKLMGPGEYVLVKPNEPSPGHFGLAVQDYTHSTAPNRRFPDMVTQRLLKAWLAHRPQPYSEDALNAIAQRCTEMEDAARKVEREMQKRIAAVVLHPHIGQSYQAIVTGVNNYGTFVRTLDPHVEGNAGPGRQGPRRGRQSDGQAGLHRSRSVDSSISKHKTLIFMDLRKQSADSRFFVFFCVSWVPGMGHFCARQACKCV